MAKFKISLVTSIKGDKSIDQDSDQSTFIPTVISNFNSQVKHQNTQILNRQEHIDGQLAYANAETSFSYTYGETISIHQNAQKELNFSMDRKIFLHDEWMDNPYVSSIHVGSLLELQDKYDNTFLFIVNKINYAFKEHNIVYQYTCQDAFSYQNTRQQSGYTITNDYTSENFIGPKTVDWWVIQKIVPECYIQYEYVPLSRGLCIEKKSEQDFKLLKFTKEERKQWTDKEGVERIIIKEPYDNEELFTPIPFSCSNSNANAALIALGDNLDLMINTYERRNNAGTYQKFFWYEPKQNQDISGVQYSPKTNIRDFGLTFQGDSLTTVLNVGSTSIGDDIVTLFPTIPDFFTTLFSSAEWKNSKFYPGYFSDIINGQNYTYTVSSNDNDNLSIGTVSIQQLNDNNNYIVIPLLQENDGLKLNPLYDYFSDNWNDEQLTILNFQINNNTYTFTGKNTTTYLIITYDNKTLIVAENQKIPFDTFINKEYAISLGIKTNYPTTASISLFSGSLYFKLYRLFSPEEKEFATIADNCPWLENRLIDFSYFYNRGIISTLEYTNLMDTLINNLRIVNGQLMYLTNNYYQAVKQKTEYISNLQQDADLLGSTFEADIVDPITRGAEIKDIQQFKNVYSTVFNIEQTNTIPIIDYSEILGEYFEKYLDSEQSFLKNCYEFRRYFNEPFKSSYSENAGLYEYKLTVEPIGERFVFLDNPSFNTIQNETDRNNTIFKYDNGSYVVADIVDIDNQTNYYIPAIQANQLIEVKEQSDGDKIIVDKTIYDYLENNKYLISKANYEKYFNSFLQENEDWLNDRFTYTINNTTYYELTRDELTRLVIAAHYRDYYIRDTNTYTQLKNVRLTQDEFKKIFTFDSLPDIFTYIDPDYKIKTNNNDGDKDEENFMWDYYKAFFPVDTIYYYGSNTRLTYKTDANNITTYYLESLDKWNKVDKTTTYKKFQPVTFANDGATLSDWGSCGTEAAEAKKDSIKNNWNYLAYCYTGDNNVYWWSLLTYAVPIVNGIIDAVGYNGGNVGFLGRYSLKNSREAIRSIEDKVYNNSQHRYDSNLGNYVKAKDDGDNILLYKKLVSKMQSLASGKPSEIQINNNIVLNLTNFNWDSLSAEPYYYWNFYKYLVATYSIRTGMETDDPRAAEVDRLFVKDSYFEILTPDSLINKQDDYVIIPITQIYDKADESNVIAKKNSFTYFKDKFEANKSYSALKYYNLIHLSKTLDIKDINLWKDNQTTIKLKEALAKLQENNNITINQNSSPLFEFQDKSNNLMKCYIARLYNYNKIAFSLDDLFPIDYNDTLLDQHNYQFDGSSEKESIVWTSVYDKTTNVLVNPLERDAALNFENTILSDLTLYMISSADCNMQPITADLTNLDKQIIYKKNSDNNYSRVYTFNQILAAKESNTNYCTKQDANKFYTLVGSSETYELMQDNVTAFTPTLYLCTVDNKDNKGLSFSSVKYNQTYNITINRYDNNQEASVNITLYDDNNIEYQSTVKIKKTLKESFKNMTNGMFWYQYNNRLDFINLFHEAANIATQLQMYWDQAYYESKYCKYFLPKRWTNSTEQVTNSFYTDIIVPHYQIIDGRSTLVSVEVSNKYVPEVSIYTYNQLNAMAYKHYLPRYIWHYNPTSTSIPSTNYYNDNQKIIQEQLNNNYVRANSIELIENNSGILSVMDTLQTNLADWEVLENGYTVYYNKVSGGTLWKKFTQQYLTTSEYDKMIGTYGIIFYKLKNVYTDNPLTDYQKVKEEKNRIWNKIYLNYPHIILEENYSYDLATSSSELYKMAQLVFKGKKEPEKNYSLSVIDYYSLLNYKGEELKPGYGIQINANEYYDENDDIYTALKQYLFITDVSYTLRKDDDLNITVNSIKYQEKLLQSLVKLIR